MAVRIGTFRVICGGPFLDTKRDMNFGMRFDVARAVPGFVTRTATFSLVARWLLKLSNERYVIQPSPISSWISSFRNRNGSGKPTEGARRNCLTVRCDTLTHLSISSRLIRFAHELINLELSGGILVSSHFVSSGPNTTASFSSSMCSGRFAHRTHLRILRP